MIRIFFLFVDIVGMQTTDFEPTGMHTRSFRFRFVPNTKNIFNSWNSSLADKYNLMQFILTSIFSLRHNT